MLKIKNSVNPRELEKFGFTYLTSDTLEYFEEDNNYWNVENIYMLSYLGPGGRRGQEYYLYVDTNGVLYVNNTNPDGSGCETTINDTLYKLIKADLVEIVEEDEIQ